MSATNATTPCTQRVLSVLICVAFVFVLWLCLNCQTAYFHLTYGALAPLPSNPMPNAAAPAPQRIP